MLNDVVSAGRGVQFEINDRNMKVVAGERVHRGGLGACGNDYDIAELLHLMNDRVANARLVVNNQLSEKPWILERPINDGGRLVSGHDACLDSSAVGAGNISLTQT